MKNEEWKFAMCSWVWHTDIQTDLNCALESFIQIF